MKPFKVPRIGLLLALLLFSVISTISYSQSESKSKPSDLTAGGTEYRMSAELVSAIALENLNQVHQTLHSERQVILEYSASDFYSNVALPTAALMPARSRYFNSNNPVNVNITPSTYPGQELNYYNRANNQRPLQVPFTVARSNP